MRQLQGPYLLTTERQTDRQTVLGGLGERQPYEACRLQLTHTQRYFYVTLKH